MRNKSIAVIVLPVYSESETLEKTIEYLFDNIFKKILNYQIKLLVVNRYSVDSASRVFKKQIKKYSDLHLIVEKKETGIGEAYIRGFKYAVEELKADVLIEFDQDFKYPSESIIDLLNEIDNGYDYVIGSRKIRRNLFMRFKRFIVRFLLFFPFKPFFKITDPVTGLKAMRVKGFFKYQYPDNLLDRDSGYKVELLFKMVELGAKVKELPVKFQVRTNAGHSSGHQSGIFKTIFNLRYHDKKTRKFIKFGIVGFIGFLVNSIFMEVFHKMHFTGFIASLFDQYKNSNFLNVLSNRSSWSGGLAIELSIISNYLFNNFWTFSKDKTNSIVKFIIKFFQFNLTSFGAVLIQFLMVGFTTLIIGDTFLVRQLTIIFSIVFLIIPYNWIVYNKLIWRIKK